MTKAEGLETKSADKYTDWYEAKKNGLLKQDTLYLTVLCMSSRAYTPSIPLEATHYLVETDEAKALGSPFLIGECEVKDGEPVFPTEEKMAEDLKFLLPGATAIVAKRDEEQEGWMIYGMYLQYTGVYLKDNEECFMPAVSCVAPTKLYVPEQKTAENKEYSIN